MSNVQRPLIGFRVTSFQQSPEAAFVGQSACVSSQGSYVKKEEDKDVKATFVSLLSAPLFSS